MLFVAAGAWLASCETDVDTPQIGTPDNFVAPVIGQCSDVIVNADNSKDETVIFSWSAADFGLPVQISYSVYLVKDDVSARVGTSSTTSLAVSKGDLNGVVLNGLGVSANETVSVQAYVTAEMNGTDNYEPVRSALSNAFTVSTYAAALKNLYVVGFFNGWSESQAVEIWETGGGTNVYEGLYDLKEDATNSPGLSGFKILDERSWNGGNWGFDAFSATSSNITSSSDGNLVLPAGYWKLSVNPVAMSIDAEQVTAVDILGTFNGWSEAGDAPLTYDAVENVWVSAPQTFEDGGEFLIRLNSSWDNKYGSSGVASTSIAGGIELVTNGGDNIPVPGAGTYVIKMYADRTPCVVELVEQ